MISKRVRCGLWLAVDRGQVAQGAVIGSQTMGGRNTDVTGINRGAPLTNRGSVVLTGGHIAAMDAGIATTPHNEAQWQ